MSDENVPAEDREDEKSTQQSQDAPPEQPAVDEQGVPWFNRFKEAERKARKWEERYSERDRAVQEMQSNFRQQMEQWKAAQTTSTPKTPSSTPTQGSNDADDIRKVIREEMQSFQTTSKWEQAKDQAFKTALDRYSDLQDEDSEFHREVYYTAQQRIKEYESMGLTPPPTTILDVANDLAASGSVKPRVSEDARPSVEKASAPPPRSKRQPDSGDEVEVPERIMALAKRAGISPEAMAKRWKTDPYSRQVHDMMEGNN